MMKVIARTEAQLEETLSEEMAQSNAPSSAKMREAQQDQKPPATGPCPPTNSQKGERVSRRDYHAFTPERIPVMPLTRLRQFKNEEVLELSRMANQFHSEFEAASECLQMAFLMYLKAAGKWNHVGASLAMTLQTHLKQMSDDLRVEVEKDVILIDVAGTWKDQRKFGKRGMVLGALVA